MHPTLLDKKERVMSLLKIASKTQPELLVHIFELQDKFDEAMKSNEETTLKIKEMLDTIPNLRPVKGKDYFTADELLAIQSEIMGKMPSVKPVDEQALSEKVSAIVKKGIKKAKDGKDAVINYEQIVQAVMDMIDIPESGVNGQDGKDGSPDTGEAIIDKLKSVKGYERFDKNFLPGPEKFVGQMELDYAISKLRNQVSFLINKVEGFTAGGGSGGGSLTGETPTGTIDGSNQDFVVTHIPIQFYWNGQYQNPNAGDYTFDSGTMTITMATPPSPGDNLASFYT